ncbi:MAG: M42 family metallopeptidase [Deltaproteobacteria bacterium]|jgi:endoglucanase|nr:M42 family metallopeptidase [Deltaproteobacteria bacterium]MBW2534271.1 M42 family metallopeptidase [Deltaproteobacteria bacterium]
MGDYESVEFLRELSEAFGPSGFEAEAARVVKRFVEPFAEEIRTDKLGSLLFTKRGSADRPVVFIPGHVDEVGFVVAGVDSRGFLAFNPVGGWFDQVLLAQRVVVRTRRGLVRGVIAAKPPHLIDPEDRKKLVAQDKMFIDIGASNRDEVKAMGVRVGDPVVPESSFSTIDKPVFEDGEAKGETTICMGKAFDDRIGVFMAAEVVRRLAAEGGEHPNTVVGAATVQEEVGLRGAGTAAWVVEPDVCLTLEVDIARDVAGIEDEVCPVNMGGGPTVLTFDATLVPNQPLKELVLDTAEQEGIDVQLSQMRRGGTDAGIIHKTHAGCPSIVLGVPTRHIHSHVGLLSLDDVERCIQLVLAVVRRLDAATVASFTAV